MFLRNENHMSVAKDAPVTSMNKFQRFMLSTKRIVKISTKPTRKQYFTMVKVCLIGLGIIGLLSYLIQLIASVIIQNT